MDDLSNVIFGDESSSPSEILSQFFEGTDIETKTRLSMPQIRTLIQLRWISECKKADNVGKSRIDILLEVLEYYLKLKVSYKGKSRQEVLEGLKSQSLIQQEQSLMGVKPLK